MAGTLLLEISVIVLALVFIFKSRPSRGEDSFLREKSNPAADLESLCMVRESFLEQPGVAQVLNGNLVIHTSLGDTYAIPLEQVKLVKVRRNKFWGSYSWWGLTCFRLETPKTGGLVLGVKDDQAWREVFKMEVDSK